MEVLAFHAELERHLAELANELRMGAYRHGGYRERLIADKKERRLLIAGVRDRLVHRLIYERLVVDFDNRFDPDVYSGRVGKGLERAVCRTQALLSSSDCGYAWRLDIGRFFESVEHDVLLRLLRGHPCWTLCRQVIDSYDVGFGRGIPIGNLTSQVFANIYLNEFDRYVRHHIRPRGYVRYGDDVVLFFATRRAAYVAKEQGSRWLGNELGLAVNPKNNYIGAAGELHFLGHIITPSTIEADAFCIKKARERVNFRNLGSYQRIRLPTEVKDALNRRILVEIEAINDSIY